ncbi:MAG: ROK family protein [Succinivibrio sp.]|nr:ROK family protein [Succinivibrio sp.]
MSRNTAAAPSAQIRESNLQLVRQILHREQIATVSRLHELTSLSVVTVSKLLEELKGKGEALNGEPSLSTGGRPAATYRFNPAFELMLIVSCYQRNGNEYAGYSVHDLFGECLERREELLADTISMQTSQFADGIVRYLGLYPKISIIGLSMPSDSVGGRVGAAVRHDQGSVRLAQHLEKRFGVPVFFETDINAATLGCYKRCKSHDYVVGLTLVPGRAPTCGFCYSGQVLRGRDGMAGEVRFFPMYNDRGVLPADYSQADDLAIRTVRAVMCVLNPGYVAIYTESLKAGLAERLKRQLPTEAEVALLPKIELSDKLRDDTVSGMISFCLEHLGRVV